MRPNNQNRRGRGRGPRKPHGGPHNHGGGQPSKAHSFDSAGPDIRVRGNAYQVLEKYLQLARDAGTAGDRVAAENFLQHADHYYRVVAAQSEGQRPRIGGREVSVADVNVHNVNQGLSAAMSGHGHGGDEQQHASDNQGNHGNGQMRSNQNSADSQNQHQNHQHQNPQHQGQGSAESQNAHGDDQASGNDAGDNADYAGPDEQPDYPENLLPADGANTAPRDGQQQDGRQGQGRGRGRRRGPGRRVRSEGEEAAPAPAAEPVPGETQ
jgi:hypothetical protein